MKTVTFFFRHPHAIYFSIEKLFHSLADSISRDQSSLFFVRERSLPFLSKISTLLKNIRFVRKSQSDINHITGDAQYVLLGCSSKNINILTVHDCVLLHQYPKSNPRHWMIRWLWYDLPAKKADAVTVISENTKKDLLRFTSCKPEKIRVISNFIEPSFQPVPGIFKTACPRLLFIGTAANKNLERTLQAIEGLNVQLIIVGYLNEIQEADIKNRQINYQLYNRLSDTEMRQVYAESDLVLFPSTYEGFGLPILEAQAIGRPVLTSQQEPMFSVAGGAAVYVDPLSVKSIQAGISKLISDETLRNEMVMAGFENVKRFQLNHIAKEYSNLYRELIKQKSGV